MSKNINVLVDFTKVSKMLRWVYYRWHAFVVCVLIWGADYLHLEGFIDIMTVFENFSGKQGLWPCSQ